MQVTLYTENNTALTPEEGALVRSLERLARRWGKDGQDLMLFSWAGALYVVKRSAIGADGALRPATVTSVLGIPNDGGDPDE